MRLTIVFCFLSLQVAFSQTANKEEPEFCHHLHKIIDSGRKDNFESVMASSNQVSPFLKMPGQSLHLEKFPIYYIDKDSRFVGKNNLNYDTLSALKKLEELKEFVGVCLDSAQWTWLDFDGEDSTTVFFHEVKEIMAISKELTLTLAMVEVAPKEYSIDLYIRRNRR